MNDIQYLKKRLVSANPDEIAEVVSEILEQLAWAQSKIEDLECKIISIENRTEKLRWS